MFVREVFHGEAKTQGEIMIDNIRNAFKRNLKNLDWMDTETRKAAEIKADAITDMIGKRSFGQLNDQTNILLAKSAVR